MRPQRPDGGSDMGSDRKKEVMAQVRRVEAILREWNPIEVAVPPDEYDGYATHIVSLVVHGCSHEQLSAHLSRVRTQTIGVEANNERDAEIAAKIIAVLGVEADERTV